MKPLFSTSGLRVLESLAFTNALYAFDFDGTLAPIVNRPEKAVPSSETLSLLYELSQLARVAVISGRSVADLKKRVRIHGDLLIGNHGLEGFFSSRNSIRVAASACNKWIKQIEHSDPRVLRDPGVELENKTFSLALHYRRSRHKKQARGALLSLLQKLNPSPRLVLGKCVINLVPAGAPHKGVAMLEAMLKLGVKSAFYIGDDDTDEDVFSLPDAGVISARVGKKAGSQAQFYLERQREMDRLLRLLIKQKHQ